MFPEMSSAITWCVTGNSWAPGHRSHPPASAATGPEGALVSPGSYTAPVHLRPPCSPPPKTPFPAALGRLTVMVDFPAFLPNLNSNGRVIFFWATIWKSRKLGKLQRERGHPSASGLNLLLSWTPHLPSPPVAFLPVSEHATQLLSLLGLPLICLWGTHVPQWAPEADALGH